MNLNVAKFWLLVAIFGLLSSTAYAQQYPQLQLQQFRPGTSPSDFLNVYGSKAAPHLEPDFGFYIDYADNPLKIPSSTERFNAVVESQMTLSIMANLGLFDIFEVGLLLPITLWQTAGNMEPVVPVGFDARNATLESFGVNDLRFHAKAQLMDLIRERLGLAVVLAGYLPIGHDDRFAGDKAFGMEGIVAADMFILRGIRLGANLGYRYRHEAEQLRDAFVGDGMMWGVAAQIPLFVDSLDFIAELDGVIGVAAKPDGQEGIRGSEVPVELKAAVRFAFHKDWTLTTGMGFGMNDEAVGTPDFRVFLGVGGYWVSGGAWGYDYDGDGIYGVYDKCPMEAEDFDGHEDMDGCPDYDNDGDGIPDELDKCPFTQPGIPVGPDGCPDNDIDGDGIPNDIDKCPEDPEDFDRFQDVDGCPDPDNDGDGVPDIVDACPNEPETFNDFMDDDGCPDDPNDKVHIARDRIIITEQVYFDTGKTSIKKESYDILNAVVEVLTENPQIVRVRIEGHTDSRGGAEMNLELSQGRAEAVLRYMTDRGIAANRLDAIGFGLARPIRDNETAEGRAYNRRVEFIIVEMRSY